MWPYVVFYEGVYVVRAVVGGGLLEVVGLLLQGDEG